MARKKLELESSISEPPMTPFIDVIFLILIFFLLSMKFRLTEGNIAMMLPKDKGLFTTQVSQPELHEVRIYICSDPQQNFQEHKGRKDIHQNVLGNKLQAGAKIGDVVYCWYEDREGTETYRLYKTADQPDKMKNNKEIYDSLCRQVQALLERVRSTRNASKPAPVVIDVDGLVPFEHTFSFISALQSMGISDIEIVGNPRFERYYGPSRR